MLAQPQSEVTYINLASKTEAWLKSNHRGYFRDIRKENMAINKFIEMELKPEYVLLLIKKLVAVKSHPDNRKDKFWMGVAENIYCALSYLQQIETVYQGLYQPVMIQPKPEPAAQAEHKTWQTFLVWAEKNLAERSREWVMNLNPYISATTIRIKSGPDVPLNIISIIQKYFEGSKITIQVD